MDRFFRVFSQRMTVRDHRDPVFTVDRKSVENFSVQGSHRNGEIQNACLQAVREIIDISAP